LSSLLPSHQLHGSNQQHTRSHNRLQLVTSRLKAICHHRGHKLSIFNRRSDQRHNKKYLSYQKIMIQMILFDSGKNVGINDIIKINLMLAKISWKNFPLKLLKIMLELYVGFFSIITKVYHHGIDIYSIEFL
jgi:hypothetical protein